MIEEKVVTDVLMTLVRIDDWDKKNITLHYRAEFYWNIMEACVRDWERKRIFFFFLLQSLFFADISKVQDDEVGDGTTSVVVLACELLKVMMICIEFS